MKKTLALVLAIALLALSVMGLVACGEKHTCCICNEEKYGCKEESLFGQKVYTCEDCLNAMEDAANDIKDGLEDLKDALS